MSIYAIGDLHLSFINNKPMDIFGENWTNHEQKIEENWKKTIKEDDLVILPGDFSWAMKLNETGKDFEFINKLPGMKVLVKGNHDYWWTTLKSMNNFICENKYKNINFLINNAYEYQNYSIVGTRGWTFGNTDNSEKMYKRELIRLENSIQYALNNYGNNNEMICAMHYPPITKQMIEQGQKSEYLELMKKYNIKKCIYGHLHGKAHNEAIEKTIDGIELKLVSSDYLNFNLYKIYE